MKMCTHCGGGVSKTEKTCGRPLWMSQTHCVLLEHCYSVDFAWWFDRKISFFSLLSKTSKKNLLNDKNSKLHFAVWQKKLLPSRGSSKVVILASQLTKPRKVKRLFSLSTGSRKPHQRYRFKAGKYKFNPNHDFSVKSSWEVHLLILFQKDVVCYSKVTSM